MTYDLVGDIGGTWARLALVDGTGAIVARRQIPSAEIADIGTACATFLAETGERADGIALAGAGPVTGGVLRLTNRDIVLAVEAVRNATGAARVLVLNDLEAAAWGINGDSLRDARTVQGGEVDGRSHCLLVSVATGLGVAIRSFQPDAVLSGEAGHMRLAPEGEDESGLFARLRASHPEFGIGGGGVVEAEAILCGAGLVRLFSAAGGNAQRPEDIVAKARAGDSLAVSVLSRFNRMLGGFVGDLSLVAADRTSVALIGGMLNAVPDLLGPAFLDAFQSGGRFSALRSTIPVRHITDPDLGLRGAWRAMRRQRSNVDARFGVR